VRRLWLIPLLCIPLILIPSLAPAEKKVACPDGDHYVIDVRQIAIKYEATRVESTLSGLAVLGVRVAVDQKTLQTAAVATQKMNEFIKGLAVGYNTCAVSREQYQQAVNRLIPDMKSGAGQLEAFRKQILDGQKIQEKRLNQTMANLEDTLRKFATISGQQLKYDQIVTIVEEQTVRVSQLEKKVEKLEQQPSLTPAIMSRLEALERRNTEFPVAKPAEVDPKIRQALLTEADRAEAAYKKGYDLLERYRFAEAIPNLEQALQAVKLPDFYTTLGRAYLDLPDLVKGEQTVREGLAYAVQRGDAPFEANMSNLLGLMLYAKGDLDGALTNTQRALAIDEKVYGAEHPDVATDANNIGTILYAKGDLDGALTYAKQALAIDEKVYGAEHPMIAIRANNIGQILRAKGDLDGALTNTQRALAIDEKVYGPEHPKVAIRANNIGTILYAKGDLDGALTYAKQALAIDEKVYGAEHPTVGRDFNNIGTILHAKGDLDGALTYAKQALAIDEKVYGAEHPDVARDFNNIGQILKTKGDLDGALTYAKQALAIDEKVYGPEHPTVARDFNNIGQILKTKGDLDGALTYAKQALAIDEKVYGAEHPTVARDFNNIGQILYAEGDLDGALTNTQRALAIDEKVYGPEHPDVARGANNIGMILYAKGDLDGALTYAKRAVAIFSKVYGPRHPSTVSAQEIVDGIRDAAKTK
jgi:tetratricopeptide (TPR) repeat protein